MSRRSRALAGLLFGVALLHTLPMTHHLHDFFARPNVADAWKGFGALAAVALLGSGAVGVGRVVALVRRAGPLALPVARAALVAAHAVPLVDHFPRALATCAFDDVWKAAGALVAIAVLATPRGFRAPWLRRARERLVSVW